MRHRRHRIVMYSWRGWGWGGDECWGYSSTDHVIRMALNSTSSSILLWVRLLEAGVIRIRWLAPCSESCLSSISLPPWCSSGIQQEIAPTKSAVIKAIIADDVTSSCSAASCHRSITSWIMLGGEGSSWWGGQEGNNNERWEHPGIWTKLYQHWALLLLFHLQLLLASWSWCTTLLFSVVAEWAHQ